MFRLVLKALWMMAFLSFKVWRMKAREGSGYLADNRRFEFIIDQFKPIFLALFALADDLIPHLTKENAIRYTDTDNLIALRDDYLSHEGLFGRGELKMFRAIFNFTAILIENNPCYKNRLAYVAKKSAQYNWSDSKITNWKEECGNANIKSAMV